MQIAAISTSAKGALCTKGKKKRKRQRGRKRQKEETKRWGGEEAGVKGEGGRKRERELRNLSKEKQISNFQTREHTHAYCNLLLNLPIIRNDRSSNLW